MNPKIKNVDAYIAAHNCGHLGTNRAILLVVYHCSTDHVQMKLSIIVMTQLESP